MHLSIGVLVGQIIDVSLKFGGGGCVGPVIDDCVRFRHAVVRAESRAGIAEFA